jgi:hypothetical protein
MKGLVEAGMDTPGGETKCYTTPQGIPIMKKVWQIVENSISVSR